MALLLEARGISKRFGAHTAVERVNLAIAAGQIVTLIGPNGSGKTTLLKLLLGLIALDEGTVERKRGLHVGYMPQKLAVDPVLPISAGTFLSMHAHHRPTLAAQQQAAEEVGVAQALLQQLHDLSGGELQRLMLARALLCEPELLVLDEPVQGVDVSGQAQLYDLIARVARARGLAVLMVSHDLHLVMSATDEVICLNRHICCAGHPQAVKDDPAFAAMFGAGSGSFAIYTHHHDHAHS